MTKFEAIRQQAQWESSRLHHYYLGVEHLFLALLETENSLTSQLLRQYNVLPELLRYELDELIGQSEDRRFWEGFRHTPRFEKILKTARALGDNDDPGEREILLAILIEGDSIPVRALEALNVNLDTLRDTAANPEYLAPPIDIASPELESELPLMATEIDLVRELFIGYNDIRIAHEFNTGRDPARMFMVQTEIAPAVVRFDHAANLIQEKRRYDTLLGPKLGVNSSHPLADITGFVTSTHLGAVKYTFSTPTETLMDLRQFALEHEQGLKHLAGIIREGIFQPLNDILWRRGERYRFNLWREYESTLPPALVVKNQPVIHVDTAFKPLQAWSFDASVEVNAHVRLEGFTVDRVMPHRKSVLLCAGRGREAVNQSAQVEITGLDDEQLAKLAAGQKVRSFEGKVIRTRKLMLLEQVMALSPGFSILGKELYSPLGTLPNPVVMLPEMLELESEGYLALIHGQFSLSNIIIDAEMNPRLLNYSSMRFGHVLFDWAMLEASILEDLVAPHISEDWESIWHTADLLYAMYDESDAVENTELREALRPVIAVREIVGGLLGTPHNWREYLAPLSMMCLVGLMSAVTPLAGRRLLFAVAALAADGFVRLGRQHGDEVMGGVDTDGI